MLGNDLELCPVQNFKKIGSELGLVIYAWALTQYPESGLGLRKIIVGFRLIVKIEQGR